MKKILCILFLALMVLSCGPTRHAIPVEMRYPSKSGVELSGKILSVVYVGADDDKSNLINENLAIGFAAALEEAYNTGKGSIGVYSVEGQLNKYAAKDSLVSLTVQTGSDAVLLLQQRILGDKGPGGLPTTVTLYCYDGMNKADKVYKFTGGKVISYDSDEQIPAEASKVGKLMAESFVPQWKLEQYSIGYYDTIKWYEALEKAEQYDWKGAMDIWFSLLDSRDLMKRATAEYNIAVACYMMGDFDLASQWLDKSMKDNDMPTLTEALHYRIEARKAAR